jgi:hypothetical protein
MSRAPESKANPHHAGPLTPPGNHIPVLFDQPALCDHPWPCAGVVREGRCHSMTLYRLLSYLPHVAPSKVDGKTLERGTVTYSAPARDGAVTKGRRGTSSLSSQPCAASPALQRHPQHCRNPGRQDIATPTAVRPPDFRQPSPRTGVQTATKQKLQHYYPRSRPWTGTRFTTTPARGEIRQDNCQLYDTVLHAAAHST